jgi:signal transduction histidine kinase
VRTEIAQRPPEAEAPERPSRLPALVLDTLEMGAVALDRERRVVYANRRIEELLGVEPGALLSLPGNRVFPGADARWLKGASRESRDFRIEAGDRDLTLRGESVPMRDEDGELAGSVVIAEAISESEDGEFQKKIDRLVSLGELSAYVAHEIRNPLTGIRTTVQFVASKLKNRDPRREDLNDVIQELDRIEQIITGLLMFARPPQSRSQACDLHQVLERTLDLLALQLTDSKVQVTRELAEELPLVIADPDLLQQVFLNLCLNAIQAMPGGGELSITTGRAPLPHAPLARGRGHRRHRRGHTQGADGEDLRPVLHHAQHGHRPGVADLGADRARRGRRDHGQEQHGWRRDPARVPAGPGRTLRAGPRNERPPMKTSVLVVDDELLIRKSLGQGAALERLHGGCGEHRCGGAREGARAAAPGRHPRHAPARHGRALGAAPGRARWTRCSRSSSSPPTATCRRRWTP